jgi:hypothetical protein
LSPGRHFGAGICSESEVAFFFSSGDDTGLYLRTTAAAGWPARAALSPSRQPRQAKEKQS